MTTSLDVSRKLDHVSVDLLLAVDSTAAALGVTYCIIGAFARDVILGLCFGIDTGEATRDIDFGLMMNDWAQFDELRARLIARKEFAEHRGVPHRLTFRGVRRLDIVPFGGIERKPGEIAWPPEFATVMSTEGLRQAHARSLPITIAEGHSVPFVSPAALTLLKLIAWSERGSAINRKDARDLGLLLTTYLRAGNEERLTENMLLYSTSQTSISTQLVRASSGGMWRASPGAKHVSVWKRLSSRVWIAREVSRYFEPCR